MALVRECWSSPAVTQPPTTKVDDLITLLAQRAISAIPIVDEGKLRGIVTSTDLVRATANQTSDLTAERVMRSNVHTIGPDDTLEEAAKRLTRARVHRLVVTDDAGRAIGVLSARDLLDHVKALRVAAPISTLMTVDLRTVDIGDPIEEATQQLIESNVHGLIVVDGRWPVGVFTQAEALAARNLPQALRARPVEEEMSYETICLDQNTPTYRAAGYFASLSARRILVVHNRELVGVLSGVDLVRAMAQSS